MQSRNIDTCLEGIVTFNGFDVFLSRLQIIHIQVQQKKNDVYLFWVSVVLYWKCPAHDFPCSRLAAGAALSLFENSPDVILSTAFAAAAASERFEFCRGYSLGQCDRAAGKQSTSGKREKKRSLSLLQQSSISQTVRS
jgi:hypothetical protein